MKFCVALVFVGSARALSSSTQCLSRRAWVASSLAGAAATRVNARPEQLTGIGLETPAVRDTDQPFRSLDTGVKYQVLKPGSGSDVVAPSSTVDLQCTGRLLNLNGVKFYSTLENADASALGGPEPLRVTLGANQLLPGLEDGLVGARKNEIRRIVVPASRGYDAAGSLEPQPTTVLGPSLCLSLPHMPQVATPSTPS
mmetsp:Transcript_11321/g.33887  ORF Transcript_11321/g.33887 Transcript_11321/m.33887 type:complete len:198 (+) Transcript_11321:36-629(+)